MCPDLGSALAWLWVGAQEKVACRQLLARGIGGTQLEIAAPKDIGLWRFR